jgi:hypothetical protein
LHPCSTLTAVNYREPGSSGRSSAGEFPAHVGREGPRRPAPLREEVEFKRATYQAAAGAEHWLGRLDEVADRMPLRRNLVRATQLREASAALDDSGVFRAFSEIVAMDLPDIMITPTVDPLALRLCRADDDAVERVLQGELAGQVLLGRTARILAGLAADSGDDILELIPWREGPAWLGGPRPEDAFMLCAPHGPELRAVVAELLTWMEADNDLPLVVRQALAHYQFAVASPVAHSGHLSGLLVVLGFIQAGALRDQIMAPSLWFSPQNERYRRVFRTVADTGDFDAWVTFFAEGVVELCRSQIELVHLLEDIRDKQLNSFSRNDGLARLVNALSGSPVFNIALAATLSGVSVRQVHTIIKRLEEADIVRKWDRNRQNRKRGQQAVREVPEVVRAIGMLDHLPFRRDRTVFGPAGPTQSDPPPSE